MQQEVCPLVQPAAVLLGHDAWHISRGQSRNSAGAHHQQRLHDILASMFLMSQPLGHVCHHAGQLRRAAVELAKAWRQDRVLRHLQVSRAGGERGGGRYGAASAMGLRPAHCSDCLKETTQQSCLKQQSHMPGCCHACEGADIGNQPCTPQLSGVCRGVVLQASMLVADASSCLEVSGSGEVLEPPDGVHAIGSGARWAIAAARALIDEPGFDAFQVRPIQNRHKLSSPCIDVSCVHHMLSIIGHKGTKV